MIPQGADECLHITRSTSALNAPLSQSFPRLQHIRPAPTAMMWTTLRRTPKTTSGGSLRAARSTVGFEPTLNQRLRRDGIDGIFARSRRLACSARCWSGIVRHDRKVILAVGLWEVGDESVVEGQDVVSDAKNAASPKEHASLSVIPESFLIFCLNSDAYQTTYIAR